LVKLALEPEWEAKFEPNSYGFRPGRSAQDAVRAIYDNLRSKMKYVLDADIAKCFDRIDHAALLQKINTYPALRRQIKAWLKAGVMDGGQLFPTDEGTPQGGVISPLASNILLTPFDWEMRRRGYQLTRYADDWCITCTSAAEARAALKAASRVLEQLGVQLNPDKTRIVHVRSGLKFLGFVIKRGSAQMCLPQSKIKRAKAGAVYAFPQDKSVRRFKDKIRAITRRTVPGPTEALIPKLNVQVRGWGEHYKRAHVRRLFMQLDCWIVRRLWAHRSRRWRSYAWRELPYKRLYGELQLMSLRSLLPS